MIKKKGCCDAAASTSQASPRAPMKSFWARLILSATEDEAVFAQTDNSTTTSS